MIPPAERQPAFILHQRPFRESSVLVELLSLDFGRVGGIVRGVKSKRRRTHHIEPFAQVSTSWRGHGQLVNVSHCELVSPWPLAGDRLFAGLYMNELLIKMLGRQEPVAALFAHYRETLRRLSAQEDLESVLRTFERHLLDELGYGLTFDIDVRSGWPIRADATYQVVQGEGFSAVVENATGAQQRRPLRLTGKQIAAIGTSDFRDGAVRRAAKHVFRGALALRLGNQRLATRDLFAARAASAANA